MIGRYCISVATEGGTSAATGSSHDVSRGNHTICEGTNMWLKLVDLFELKLMLETMASAFAIIPTLEEDMERQLQTAQDDTTTISQNNEVSSLEDALDEELRHIVAVRRGAGKGRRRRAPRGQKLPYKVSDNYPVQ